MGISIGVLALQGSFREHEYSLHRLGVKAIPVRFPEQLGKIAGLIIPGGESTTIGKLMTEYRFIEPLREKVLNGLPVYGTCAGLILLASYIGNREQPILGVMDISVKRNAFGRQCESFEEALVIPALGERPFKGIFIRAPLIEKVGKSVKVLAQLNNGTIIAAEQKNLLVSAFHPELTDDLRMHRYFLDKIAITQH